MLTHEAIDKIVKEERAEGKLVKLPENFFEDVRLYLSKKAEIGDKEVLSAKALLRDLREKREKKILYHAIYFVRNGIIPGNMTPRERKLFDAVIKSLQEFQKTMDEVIEGEPEKVKVVAVLEDVEEFVGLNMKTYGPFKKGDVATIPEENAHVLLEQKKAKEIAIDSTK